MSIKTCRNEAKHLLHYLQYENHFRNLHVRNRPDSTALKMTASKLYTRAKKLVAIPTLELKNLNAINTTSYA